MIAAFLRILSASALWLFIVVSGALLPACLADFNGSSGQEDTGVVDGTAPDGAPGDAGQPDGGQTDASPSCGDGVVDSTEQCDDGPMNSDIVPNACRSNCLLPRCGDNVIDESEQCDDGPANSNTLANACRISCQQHYCGDGVLDAGEACDDGNSSNTDACPNTCVPASCGDGFVRSGVEQCDDGNSSNTDACLNTCVSASCGDGYMWSGQEECDDGNSTAGDGCSPSCDAESLPSLRWLSSTSSGWSTPWTLYYAGETHAPTTPVQAAVGVEGAGRVIFFTQSTYHVLRIPTLTWYDSGTQNLDFAQLPASGPTGGFGLDNGSSTTVTLIAGHWAHLFEYTHTGGNVSFLFSDDIDTNQDWSTPEAPDPNLLTAMYYDPDNVHGWVNDSLLSACGVGAGPVSAHIVSLTASSLHLQEIGNCFDYYNQMSYSAFPPFGITVPNRPSQSSVRGLFYYRGTGTLYAVTQ